MKKIMFGLAAAIAMVAAADIVSANIVGYSTKSIDAGKYYLIGVQFNKTGADAGSISMDDLISLPATVAPGTYDADFAGAPEILVLNAAGGYNKFYYISDATDDNDVPLGYNCWADMDGYELKPADKLALGKGFWFKSATAGTITVAGEVSAAVDAVQSFPANQYYIMSNPFPKAFSLADVTTTGVTPGEYDADFAGASEVLVLNAAGGYNKFYYISDATDDNDAPVGYNCWADMDGYILNGVNQLQAGESFWIKGNAAGSLGFKK